jgi:hypothetical protein
MEMFVNIQAFLSTLQTQGQMQVLLVGTRQILPATPTRYGLCVVVQSEDTLEYLSSNDKIIFVKPY